MHAGSNTHVALAGSQLDLNVDCADLLPRVNTETFTKCLCVCVCVNPITWETRTGIGPIEQCHAHKRMAL